MIIYPNTQSNLLSGNFDFSSMLIKGVLTQDYQYNVNVLSDITNIHSMSFTLSSVAITIDIGVASSSKSISLTSSDCFFPDVTGGISGSTTYFYLYKDTGNPSTSPILFSHSIGNFTGYGEVFYAFNNKKIFYLRDTDDYYGTNRFLYRTASDKMLRGLLGNLQTVSLKVGFLKNTHTPNIEKEFLSDVSSDVVTQGPIINKYINLNVLKTDTVVFGDSLITETIGGIVVYIDSGSPSTSPLLCFYKFSDLYILNKKPTVGFYQNIILSL